MLDIKFTLNGATVIFRPTEFSLKKYYLLEISVHLKSISNMATNKNLIDYSYGDHTKLESVKNQFLKNFFHPTDLPFYKIYAFYQFNGCSITNTVAISGENICLEVFLYVFLFLSKNRLPFAKTSRRKVPF